MHPALIQLLLDMFGDQVDSNDIFKTSWDNLQQCMSHMDSTAIIIPGHLQHPHISQWVGYGRQKPA